MKLNYMRRLLIWISLYFGEIKRAQKAGILHCCRIFLNNMRCYNCVCFTDKYTVRRVGKFTRCLSQSNTSICFATSNTVSRSPLY